MTKLIFSIKSCLPEDLKKNASSMKKELMAEYEKKKGLSEIDAIFEYVKLARGLETFGIHFFLVRVMDHLSMNSQLCRNDLRNSRKADKRWFPFSWGSQRTKS